MFLLTNEQRECFALNPIQDHWECIEAKTSPYDGFKTYLYLDGDTIVKCILSGKTHYHEYELYEKVSQDRKYLLPKTSKGKPMLLSSYSVLKRTGTGMALSCKDAYVCLWNDRNECDYYSNRYLNDGVCDLNSFSKWVEEWCSETTDADKADIICFSQQPRKHIRYREGDVFRFKIDRRLYGYGRILLDYDKMRKEKQPFWDILMSKPLVCSVYHIVTARDDVSVDELKSLKSLPSNVISDNSLYYGEFEIIGNIPISNDEDYPIMYGNSIHFGEKAVCYQCGKVYRKLENRQQIYGGFKNNGVGFSLNFTLDILRSCIEENSNEPYWERYYQHFVNSDLRNPKYAEKLEKIRKQFGL